MIGEKMHRITITIDETLRDSLLKQGNLFNVSSVCRAALREKIASLDSDRQRRIVPRTLGHKLLLEKNALLKDWSDSARDDAERFFMAGKITYDELLRLVDFNIAPKVVKETFKQRYMIPDQKVKKYNDRVVRSIHFITYKNAFREVVKEFLEALE